MLAVIDNSVVLIRSSDKDESSYGTGFVVSREKEFLIVLTCAHVVRDVGGADKVMAAGIKAHVIVSDSSVDMALLKVDIPVERDIPEATLSTEAQVDDSFRVAGFQKLTRDLYEIKPLEGKLVRQKELRPKVSALSVSAWDLHFTGKDKLQKGYSGSPIADPDTNRVLGVVTVRTADDEGVAISTVMLKKLLPAVPEELENTRKVIAGIQEEPVLPGGEGVPFKTCTMLPYLVDRNSQRDKLFNTIEKQRSLSQTSPIVAIIHGNYMGGHEKFLKCTVRYYWYKTLRFSTEQAELKVYHINWPEGFHEYEDFERSILREIRRNMKHVGNYETYDEIANAVNRTCDRPLIYCTRVDTGDFQKNTESVIDSFIRFWKPWPRRDSDKPLIAVIMIEYTEHEKKSFRKIFRRIFGFSSKKTFLNNDIRDAVTNIEKKGFGELRVLALHELEGITRGHVKDWTEIDEVKKISEKFDYDFNPYIYRLYERREEYHMADLAKELGKKLREFQ